MHIFLAGSQVKANHYDHFDPCSGNDVRLSIAAACVATVAEDINCKTFLYVYACYSTSVKISIDSENT